VICTSPAQIGKSRPAAEALQALSSVAAGGDLGGPNRAVNPDSAL